jgi:alpha-L-fucosidase
MKRPGTIGYLLCGIASFLCSISMNYAQTKAPGPFGPVPTENQMRWQEMKYYAFVHWSMMLINNLPV